MKQFSAPKQSFSNVDAESAATLIAAAADVALIVDRQGVIRDISLGSEDLAVEGYANWVGKPWRETVTVESRSKIEALIQDAATDAPPKWRQVNHPSAHGADVPILYSTIQLGPEGRMVAVGRNLRAMASLQQRLMDAQQSMERDYTRLRQVETRYRLLFQMSTESLLIVDAATHKVLEANPTAVRLLGNAGSRAVGRSLQDNFDSEGKQSLQTLFAGVRASGWAQDVRVHAVDVDRDFIVSASLFRQDGGALFLVRLSPVGAGEATMNLTEAKAKLLDLVESAPDGFVVTTTDGEVISANRAFLDMLQLTNEEQVRGQSLDKWLNRPGVDLKVLVANLRQYGAVRLFATKLKSEFSAPVDVEISAVSVLRGESSYFGFSIRNVGRRLNSEARSGQELPRSVEELIELVGRVSLKDLVREATDLIERLSIEAALELTGDNRASAAEMLGLSRQSLYVKLRRYGLADIVPETEKQS